MSLHWLSCDETDVVDDDKPCNGIGNADDVMLCDGICNVDDAKSFEVVSVVGRCRVARSMDGSLNLGVPSAISASSTLEVASQMPKLDCLQPWLSCCWHP